VIGGGVAGLTSAWTLLDRGYTITVLAAQFPKPENKTKITSQVAGAFWEWPPAVCGRHADKATLEICKKLSLIAYRRFKSIAEDPVMSGVTGVTMRTSNFFFKRPLSADPTEMTKMEEIRANIPGLRHDSRIIQELGINPDYGVVDAYSHPAPAIDSERYMSWLYDYLFSRGVTFIDGKLSGDLLEQEKLLLEKYTADIILNATGLGSKELANDETVYPLRGALVRVMNDGSKFPRLTQLLCVSLLDGQEAANDMIMIVPRNDNLMNIGGLAEPNEWDINLNFENHEPLKLMLERNREFLPALKFAAVNKELPISVGLRCMRKEGLRMEREARIPPGGRSGDSRIVHCYGLGGEGYSQSFGIAQVVADIIDEIANEIISIVS